MKKISRRGFITIAILGGGLSLIPLLIRSRTRIDRDRSTLPLSRRAIPETNKPSRLPENVPGKYYVNSDCIGSGVCARSAPEIFKIKGSSNTLGFAYVAKQPEMSEEVDRVKDAIQGCPVDAIQVDQS